MANQFTDRACIVLTTWPNRQKALKFAQQIVENQLAACVNLLPEICSVYAWEGKIEQAEEHQMLIKTCNHLVPEIVQQLAIHHPYSEPECISIDIADGAESYLNWIKDHCR
ncbi:MAG TPA: hypothetical protein DCZ03_01605 [Gammaproteobacteria bacterium]|nr:hypothetical protein [Gammaproteobacteria bacterium]